MTQEKKKVQEAQNKDLLFRILDTGDDSLEDSVSISLEEEDIHSKYKNRANKFIQRQITLQVAREESLQQQKSLRRSASARPVVAKAKGPRQMNPSNSLQSMASGLKSKSSMSSENFNSLSLSKKFKVLADAAKVAKKT